MCIVSDLPGRPTLRIRDELILLADDGARNFYVQLDFPVNGGDLDTDARATDVALTLRTEHFHGGSARFRQVTLVLK